METNNDSHWKYGIFYYNKDDKRIFCPKRLPFTGWTINFANPYSILIVGGIVVLILIFSIYTDKKH